MPCLFAPGKMTLKISGGTCGQWQASVDYLQNILLPYLQRFAEKIELKILKRGYYPQGGGEIQLEINPKFKLVDYENFQQLYFY
jgi:RNA 3'-terminal phosphate cyclase